MSERMLLAETAPAAYQAMLALEKSCKQAVDPTLFELVKMRASMMNGCAFCLDMRGADALAAGEDVRRLFALSAWRETDFFTDTERAALALTEAITNLGPHGVPDDVWDAAEAVFDTEALAGVVMAAVTINAWNRMGVTTRRQPAPLA